MAVEIAVAAVVAVVAVDSSRFDSEWRKYRRSRSAVWIGRLAAVFVLLVAAAVSVGLGRVAMCFV